MWPAGDEGRSGDASVGDAAAEGEAVGEGESVAVAVAEGIGVSVGSGGGVLPGDAVGVRMTMLQASDVVRRKAAAESQCAVDRPRFWGTDFISSAFSHISPPAAFVRLLAGKLQPAGRRSA